jgi:hypothetical protein
MVASVLIAGAIIAGIILLSLFFKNTASFWLKLLTLIGYLIFFGALALIFLSIGVSLAKKGGAIGVFGGFLVIIGLVFVYCFFAAIVLILKAE